MNESYYSKCSIWAAIFWGLSVLLLAAIWTCAAMGADRDWLIAKATTFVFTSTIAATLQVRSYMVRLCAVVRATAGLTTPEPEKIRVLR